MSFPAEPRLASRAALLLIIALITASCAASAARRAGQLAESEQDFDRAVVEYTKLVQARPNDRTARASLEQAKLRASQAHFTTGRRLASLGKLEEALLEFQLAHARLY